MNNILKYAILSFESLQLSPFLRHSVLKRTFNVTLLNPLITKTENIIEQKAKSRHPGGKTQASKQ